MLTALLAMAMAVVVAVPATADSSTTRTFEVTITNNTATQWFTPPAVAIHGRALDLFSVRRPASHEVMQIAENGNLDPMIALLDGSAAVASYGVAVTEAGPLAPGQSVTITLDTSQPNQRFLSTVAMLICTNDGFTGVDSIPLPGAVGHTRTVTSPAWDAGTEINTEDFADIVPPCQLLNGVSSDDEGTGTSNPALAENGRIHRHSGIVGGVDLTLAAHGWNVSAPAVVISITRTS
jgi:hypothetical protein